MASKETEQLLKRVRKHGGEVDLNGGGGHIRVTYEGRTVVMPSTPSDSRSIANAVAQLQRIGMPLRQTHKKRSTIGTRQSNALAARLEAVLQKEQMTVAAFVRKALEVGEEKGIRRFKNEKAGGEACRRILDKRGVGKWIHDLVNATCNVLENPPPPKTPIPLERAEAQLPSPGLYVAPLAEEWDTVFDSLDRTLKLLRGAVRRTMEELQGR